MVNVTDGVPEFAAVVEAGGFRAAGRQLGVSGTALSKTLRQLEQRLGGWSWLPPPAKPWNSSYREG